MRLASKSSLAFLGVILTTFALAVAAAQDPWLKYENRHFVTYSDADDSEVIALLDNLERFRGAVLQVSNITIPESAPKTLVLIARDRSTFSRFSPSRHTAGFAMSVDGQPIIVLSTSGSDTWVHSLIRHEYGHILLRFMNFSYPQWYEEGFAEMVSATRFKDEGRAFTLGDTPVRAKNTGKLSYDWDTLVSDDFKPHAIGRHEQASSAYFQAWLLAHYATLGDNGKNARKLQSYFALLENGQTSEAAFRNAFGMSASDLWRKELKPYTNRIPQYVMRFNPGILDTDFTRTPAPVAEYEPIINYLELRAIAIKRENPVPDPLALLSGDWDALTMGPPCSDPGAISVDREKSAITFHHFRQEQGGQWRPETFSYSAAGGGQLSLEPAHAARALGATNLALEMPSERLLCIRSPDPSEFGCYGVLTKCE